MAAENIGARRFEEERGLKKWTLRGLLDPERQQSPSVDRAREICEALGLEFYIGPPRGKPGNREQNYVYSQGEKRVIPGGQARENRRSENWTAPAKVAFGPAFHLSADQPEAEVNLSDFSPVPLHNIELSAGHGFSNEGEEVTSHILFRRSWMQEIGIAPKNARLAKVRGASMYPLLAEGDIVMLDSSKTKIPTEVKSRHPRRRRSHLFVLEQEGEARVKWVERPDAETLIVYSENIAVFRPEIYTRRDAHMIRLVGRVVWWSHTVSAE